MRDRSRHGMTSLLQPVRHSKKCHPCPRTAVTYLAGPYSGEGRGGDVSAPRRIHTETSPPRRPPCHSAWSGVHPEGASGGARFMINDLWYKNAVIYCLSVGTFMDSNGDGIGDFEGLMRRLDYLQGLGVTAIWLMPFQKSPGKDDGYDISDYRSEERRVGKECRFRWWA